MNKQLLHKIQVKKGITNEDIARKLGISRQSYQSRLSGKLFFHTDEIQIIKEYLKLSDEDVMCIFFTENVK